jgi:O-antigen ligase
MFKLMNFADLRKPAVLFCIGWAIVLLSLTASFPPVWNTFIHSWRVEWFASVFLFVALISAYIAADGDLRLQISREELRYLVLPICVFICWSFLSVTWAASWKSAIHHGLVWSEYLIFYLFVRHLVERDRNYSKLLTAAVLPLAFYGVLAAFGYCLYLIFTRGTTNGIVYSKFGEQVNTLFPLVLVGVLRLGGKRLAAGLGVLVCLWLLVFCSLSRIDLILFFTGMLLAAAVVFALKQFRRHRLKFVLVAACLIAAPFPLHLASLFSADDKGIPVVERINDSSGITSSNNFRKLMMSLASEMISTHPIIGIGADNFGFEVNKYRAAYAARNPDDPNLVEAEDTIPERAHNEYLQITAELGVVGATIFLWFLSGIAIMVFRAIRARRYISLYAVAALTGIALFLISSLVTSFSFRLMQNGMIFFFVLAVAASRLMRQDPDEKRVRIAQPMIRFVYASGFAATLLLFTYCTVRVISVAYCTQANSTADIDDAIPLYQTAIALDNEDPEARYFLGLRLVDKGRYTEAVPYLKESIRIGRAPSADFSYLASAQSLAGDNAGAEKTFAEATSLYPLSPFVLTRYATLLHLNGKESECEAELERSRRISLRQTNSWWTFITQSPQAATDLALHHDDYAPLMELEPLSSMYAIKAEREIRHPEEKFDFKHFGSPGQ